MNRALRSWQSMSSKERKKLGKRDYDWMQGRISEYDR